MYAYYDHDLHILHVSMMLCRKCIGQGKGPIKHMDTQSTMPWTGGDTQDSPAGVPSLVLADLLELGKDDLGRALFFQSLRLGPGASAFREFVLNGLCFIDGEKMMMEDDGNDPKRFAKLQHVHNMTAQLIKDATEKTGARDHFVAEGYEKVLTSAQMSVVKVKAMADRDADKAKAEAQKQKADVWLSREVAALDKRKADLSLAATKAASFAAGKVHALINHLRSMGLLSRYFVEQMELWSQLDSTDAAARTVRKEQKQKELEEMAPVVLFAADTTVQDSGPQWCETLLDPAPDHELQGSGPQESLRDSAPDHKLQGSGAQESLRDSSPDRELQGSGPQESLRDSALDPELQGSGPQESLRDSAPDQESVLVPRSRFEIQPQITVLVPRSRFEIQPQITVLVPRSRFEIQPQIASFKVRVFHCRLRSTRFHVLILSCQLQIPNSSFGMNWNDLDVVSPQCQACQQFQILFNRRLEIQLKS